MVEEPHFRSPPMAPNMARSAVSGAETTTVPSTSNNLHQSSVQRYNQTGTERSDSTLGNGANILKSPSSCNTETPRSRYTRSVYHPRNRTHCTTGLHRQQRLRYHRKINTGERTRDATTTRMPAPNGRPGLYQVQGHRDGQLDEVNLAVHARTQHPNAD